MFHMLIASGPTGGGINTAYLVTAILAAVVVIVAGIGGLIRVIWKSANIMRDLMVSVKDLTRRFDDMIISVDGRFEKLSSRVLELEQREFGRHDGIHQPGSAREAGRDHGGELKSPY